MPTCERCGTELSSTGGVLSRLLSNAEGLACDQCGAVLCQDCYDKRRRELLTSGSHRSCPVCKDGMMRPR